jgi:hypothetical protein
MDAESFTVVLFIAAFPVFEYIVEGPLRLMENTQKLTPTSSTTVGSVQPALNTYVVNSTFL